MSDADTSSRPVAVIAFGGNALLRPTDHGTQEEQFTLAWKATRWLYEIIHRGYELAIVHGNGPQVGNIMIQVEEAITKIPPQSLDVAVAQTQGSMGFMLANQLRNRFNEEQLEKEIAAVFTAYRANLLMQEEGWQMVEDPSRGWRKVVASPMPARILGNEYLRKMISDGVVVIAGGGGGVPVYQDVGGYYRGIEAVIDKDYVASILARDLEADLFIVLTNVPMVAENFGRPQQRWLRRLPVRRAREMLEANQFPPGSMGPKVRSAIQFVEVTGKDVLITDAEHLKSALERTAGTFIVADGDVETATLAQ
jgi:carbamate kinase